MHHLGELGLVEVLLFGQAVLEESLFGLSQSCQSCQSVVDFLQFPVDSLDDGFVTELAALVIRQEFGDFYLLGRKVLDLVFSAPDALLARGLAS